MSASFRQFVAAWEPALPGPGCCWDQVQGKNGGVSRQAVSCQARAGAGSHCAPVPVKLLSQHFLPRLTRALPGAAQLQQPGFVPLKPRPQPPR